MNPVPVGVYRGPANGSEQAVAHIVPSKDKGRIYAISAIFMLTILSLTSLTILHPGAASFLLIAAPVIALCAAETDFFEDGANVQAVLNLAASVLWHSADRSQPVVHVHHRPAYRWWF